MKKTTFFTLLIAIQILSYLVIDNYTYGIINTINDASECFEAFICSLLKYDNYSFAQILMGKLLVIVYLILLTVPLLISIVKKEYLRVKKQNGSFSISDISIFGCVFMSIISAVIILACAMIFSHGAELISDDAYSLEQFIEILILLPSYAIYIMFIFLALNKIIDPFDKKVPVLSSDLVAE